MTFMNLRKAPFCSKFNLEQKGKLGTYRVYKLSRIVALNFDFRKCEIFITKLRTLRYVIF
jgi:hypothetical protein